MSRQVKTGEQDNTGGEVKLRWIAIAAAIIAGTLPLLGLYAKYEEISAQAQSAANVQAVIVGRYAQIQPDNWMYKPEHLEVALTGIRQPDTLTQVQNEGQTVLSMGTISADTITFSRRAEFSIFGNRAGELVVSVPASGFLVAIGYTLLLCLGLGAALLWLLKHFVLDHLREAEIARKKTKEVLQDLVELSSDWFWEQDSEYRFTFNTNHSTGVGGFSEMIGKRRWERGTNLSEAQWAAHRADLDARHEFTLRYGITDKGQTIRWFETRGRPVFDSDGTFIGYRGTGTDITQQKLAEMDIKLAATAFQSREGIYITDASYAILRVNQAFIENTGYAAEEVIGRSPDFIQADSEQPKFFDEMWKTINRTGEWHGEALVRPKSGKTYPIFLNISTLKDSDDRVSNYVCTYQDITERKKTEERIEELAFFDSLTHLPNRTLLRDRLKQAIAAASRNKTYGAILFLDLDNFKSLNDTGGHEKGDELLKQVAQRLINCLREQDTVARLGGDEFVVVLVDLHEIAQEAANQTELIGEKILGGLNEIYRLGDLEYQCTASIGATLFDGGSISMDELLKQADMAMYRSKETGRNALSFFDPAMQTTVTARVLLEKDMRRAIQERQFILHYQALVMGEGVVAGAEALVRWIHPERGMVSPADFIPVAEETGLILPLGHWVLETACSTLARWATQSDMAHLTMSVNISARQSRQSGFVEEVLAIIKNTGANPMRLKLELTESSMLENVEEMIEKMHRLKLAGVSFSLDDFGTGYSSLAYLKRLPLDELKIDQSFVRDIYSDPNDAAVVRTVIVLAQSFGMSVIAEGVETEEQRSFLAGAGCHAWQGYLFRRPEPIEKFEAFVRGD